MPTSPSNPEKEPRSLPDSYCEALTPPRGEVFEVELDENGEVKAESQTPGQKKAGAWFFAILAALFCVYNVGAYVGKKSKDPAPIILSSGSAKPALLRVQIAGRVKKPGVYSLPEGSRIEDALKKAGNALPDADLSALNLADWAADGAKIEVPARQKPRQTAENAPVAPSNRSAQAKVVAPQNGPDETSVAPANTAQTSPRNARPRAGNVGKNAPAALANLRNNPVDLNRASAEQLSVLPGVGPKLAERIVAYRTENGNFNRLSDLDGVKGIGEKRLETLKPLVKIN